MSEINLPDFKTIPQENWADEMNLLFKRFRDEIAKAGTDAVTAKSAMTPTGCLEFFPKTKSRLLPSGYKESETVKLFTDIIIAEKK